MNAKQAMMEATKSSHIYGVVRDAISKSARYGNYSVQHYYGGVSDQEIKRVLLLLQEDGYEAHYDGSSFYISWDIK